MPSSPIRVLSDLHYGDRSSRIGRIDAIQPLLEGASAVVINGDTTDTRPGPRPAYTTRIRAEVKAFFDRLGIPVTHLTGNHDPDISDQHLLDLAGGAVWAFHGDVLFEEIVPWGADGPLIRRRIRAQLRVHGQSGAIPLATRFAVFREVARQIPQRHQSERRAGRYVLRLMRDVLWPPWRVPQMLAAWGSAPGRARAFAREHRPEARFVLVGHTHLPGLWRSKTGATVINTGSFTRPFAARIVDLEPGRLRIRAVRRTAAGFFPGPTLAEFPF